MKILIADDDELSRKMMGMVLRKMGYEVVAAENGRDALDKLLNPNGPRLAILDWMMPEIDGPQVCRSLRAANEQPYVFVILLTSKDSREDLVEGLDAGADEYLTKPCNSEELKARLRTGERILQLEDKLVAAREEMRFKATHDALTCLWNREKILEALDDALRHVESMAVLMCDIDHFKRFNDTFGHQAGDVLLRALGDFLSQRTRGQDVACRYGGEEFVIILAESPLDAAIKRADILREEVKHLSVQHAGQLLGTISLSIGVSAFPTHGKDAGNLLHAADSALYRAKAEGRDRVVLANA